MTSKPPISEFLRQTRAWLENAGLSLTAMPRLSSGAVTKHRAHRGFWLALSASRPMPRQRDNSLLMMADQLTVELYYRVRPLEQLSSELEAVDLEEKVIARLTDTDPFGYRYQYEGTPLRGPHPTTAEYYLCRLQFSLSCRQITLGESV